MNPREIIKPQKLKTGDRIVVLSPSDCVDREGRDTIRMNARYLSQRWGVNFDFSPNWLAKTDDYYAGEPEVRIGDIEYAVTKSGARVIWCSCGGYDALRLMEAFEDKTLKRKLKENPMLWMGYSDNTLVLLKLLDELGMTSVMAPTMWGLRGWTRESIEGVRRVMTGKSRGYLGPGNCVAEYKHVNGNKDGREPFVRGRAEGMAIAANLESMVSAIASGADPIAKIPGPKILFLEEVSTEMNGVMHWLDAIWSDRDRRRNIAAVVFGRFADIRTREYVKWSKARELKAEIADRVRAVFGKKGGRVPVVAFMPFFGHAQENDDINSKKRLSFRSRPQYHFWPIPNGVQCRVEVGDMGRVTFTESVVD